MSDKQKIKEAFAELRKNGFVARMNFSCCTNCALYELLDKYGKEMEDYVFYNRQDNDSFDKNGNLKYGLFLKWGGNTNTIIDALTDKNLVVEWDGSEHSAVRVLTEEIEEREKE